MKLSGFNNTTKNKEDCEDTHHYPAFTQVAVTPLSNMQYSYCKYDYTHKY